MYLILISYPSRSYAYTIIQEIQGGAIKGTVKWSDSVIPAQYIHKIEKNADFCGKTFLDDALVINTKNRGMQNVLVYLENINKGRKPQQRYVNVVKGCRFHPRVMGVVKGQLIGFRHDDFITHNVHMFRLDNNATVLNFGLPIHRWQQTITRKHRRAGFYRMQCDIHIHMNGLVVSLEHDYFSITNADGEFEITDIPPGQYRLTVFQGGYRIQNMKEKGKKGFRPIFEKPHQMTNEVEVKMDETTTTAFEFDLES
ncbi:carboxypeptidase regulatory-like domain-containing protein [Nitrospira defluvii]|nr:carboxypeptidase regulatory-like domain-containing protein [Nitrospira defluvii]